MSWIENDICWCYNSMIKDEKEGCKKKKCFRHFSHRKPQPKPDIYSCAFFKNTIDCPFYQEGDKYE